MNKLKKTASILDTIIKIIYRIYLVVNVIAGIIIFFVLYLCLADQKIIGLFSTGLLRKLNFGGISFTLSDSIQPMLNNSFWLMGIPLIIGFAGMILFVMVLRRFRYILEPMKEGNPFVWQVYANFRELGFLTLAGGVLDLFLTAYQSYTFTTAYDFNALFLSDKITAVTTSYHFDFSFILIALVLFGMSYIFHYGEVLQKLSDETL